MATDTIRLRNGSTLSGRITEHCGDGVVTIEHEGKRYTGRKVSTERKGR